MNTRSNKKKQPQFVEYRGEASAAQRRQWIFSVNDPSSTKYNTALSWEIEGAVEVDKLEHAFEVLVSRHTILRTGLGLENGRLMQYVFRTSEPEFSHINCQGEAYSVILQKAQDIIKKPFQLSEGRCARFALIEVSSLKSILIIACHHAVIDEWSWGIIVRDLEKIYSEPSDNLGAVAVQYSGYSIWHNEFLKSSEAEAQRTYWQNKFSNPPPLLELAIERNHNSNSKNILTGEAAFEIDENLTSEVFNSSRVLQVTPFHFLFSVFCLLISRYCNSNDITVCYPSSGRSEHFTHEAVGLFTNTLAARARIDPKEHFKKYLKDFSRSILQDSTSGELPFEEIARASFVRRDIDSRYSIEKIMFNWENQDLENLELPGLNARPLRLLTDEPICDLSLKLKKKGEVIEGVIVFDREKYELNSIQRLCEHYCNLIRSAAHSPNSSIGRLEWLEETEANRLINEFGQAEHKEFDKDPIHLKIEEFAKTDPNAIALHFDDRTLTRGELEKLSNRLARRLQASGVTLGVPVGVHIENSIELIVAFIAILKVGGIYLPLSREQPVERLTAMISDSSPRIILARRGDIFSDISSEVITLGSEELFEEFSDHPIQNTVSGSDPAYIIFTSGSTGQPKGVAISHSAVCNCLNWAKISMSVNETDCSLLKASISFDLSIYEMLLPLTTGGRLVIARSSSSHDPIYLIELVVAQGVSLLHITPSFLRVLLSQLDKHVDVPIRVLTCGGESLSSNLRDSILESLPNCKLMNCYGPSETAIIATSWSCVRGKNENPVPIGRPTYNTIVRVLDENIQLVPIGFPGKLYIGGPQVGIEYWNNPELTNKYFISDPFDPQNKLYRTGDLVKFHDEGMLEFIGRADRQIKINGQRVELAEIEKEISELPEVRDVVVTFSSKKELNKLVAYIVSNSSKFQNDVARDILSEKLPLYMVPRIWILVDEIALNSNGKVDFEALPKPSSEELRGVTKISATDAIQTEVASKWSDALDVEVLNAEDNFFDMGGHSLVAIDVCAKLQASLNLDFEMGLIFRFPTVEEFSRAISNAKQSDKVANVVTIREAESGPILFCVHDATGLPNNYYRLASEINLDISIVTVECKIGWPGELNDISGVASEYLNLGNLRDQSRPIYILGFSFGCLIAHQMAHLLGSDTRSILIDPPGLNESGDFSEELAIEEIEEVVLKSMEANRGAVYQESSSDIKASPVMDWATESVSLASSYHPESSTHRCALLSTYDLNLLDHAWKELCLIERTSTLPGDHFTVFLKSNLTRLALEVSTYIEDTMAS